MTLTVMWLAFVILWAAKSIFLRRGRKYASHRVFTNRNSRFKFVSYFVFAMQLVVVPILFWFNHFWLFKFHESDGLKFIGIGFCFAGLALYLYSIKHLGRNYSPCFDSHIPFELVSTGPYRLIRHPGWFSKILVSLGGILVAGSIWFIPILYWIVVEMRRTVLVEEGVLVKAFPEYESYKANTCKLIPFFY